MSEKIRIKTVLPKNSSNEDRKVIRVAVDELAEKAKDLAPEGTLLVSVYDKGSAFTPIVKVANYLMDLEIMYSFSNIQRDPSLIQEYQEILEAVKTIEKLVGKRKKKRRDSYKKRTEHKED